MIRRKGSPYEVRCPRCDVSFPVETRRCVHCGGSTAPSDAPAPIAIDVAGGTPWTRAPDVVARAPGTAEGPGAPGAPSSGRAGPVEMPEEAPPSLASTLVRTFGSLFWVIALIAFSIVRSCGED